MSARRDPYRTPAPSTVIDRRGHWWPFLSGWTELTDDDPLPGAPLPDALALAAPPPAYCKHNNAKLRAAVALRDAGLTTRAIGAQLGVSFATVARWLRYDPHGGRCHESR